MRRINLPVWVKDDLNTHVRDAFNQVAEHIKSRLVTYVLAFITLGTPATAVAADHFNIVDSLPLGVDLVAEKQRAAGEYNVTRIGDRTTFAKISEPAPTDPQKTLTLNVISDFGDINIVGLRTGASTITTGLQVASLTPGTDFDCDTLSIASSQIPKLDLQMKAWTSMIRDNVASGNDHTLNMTDLGGVYAKTRPVVPVNAYGLGTLDVSGDYDKVEINVSTSAVIGRITVHALGIRDGLFSVVDAHCGSIIVSDNLIGEGSGIGPVDPKDFIAVIEVDSGGTHTITNNVESDIKIR